MYNLLPSVNVEIEVPEIIGKDQLGNPIKEYNKFFIEDCLVIGQSSVDLGKPAEDLDKTYIRVDLPKTYTGEVSEGYVYFVGRKFKIEGNPIKNPFSPLKWDRYFLAYEVR